MGTKRVAFRGRDGTGISSLSAMPIKRVEPRQVDCLRSSPLLYQRRRWRRLENQQIDENALAFVMGEIEGYV
jgi:hypothetical protein